MENHNLPAPQKNRQDLQLLEQKKPYLLTLKENNVKWKQGILEEKEDCLNYMVEILGIKVASDEEQDSINRQMVLINDLISRYYQNLTAQEIKEAFRLYVFKQFAEVKVFRLIDCVAVGEILNAYIEYRNQIIEPFLIKRQNLLNAPAEKTIEEKEKIFNDFVKMIFDEVSEKGYCQEAWYIFKNLEEKGKINFSNEEKQSLYLKELAIYVPEERKRIMKNNAYNFKAKLNDFEKTYQNGKRPVYVKNRCRSILVSKYIYESKIEFEELLTILK